MARSMFLQMIAVSLFAACGTQAPLSTGTDGLFGFRRVQLCHRTMSERNPWVRITVSENALGAHLGHGDVVPDEGTCPPSSGPGDGDDGGGESSACSSVGFSLLNPGQCDVQAQLLVTGAFSEAPTVLFDGDVCDGGALIEDAGDQKAYSYSCWYGVEASDYSTVAVTGGGIDCEDQIPTGCSAQ